MTVHWRRQLGIALVLAAAGTAGWAGCRVLRQPSAIAGPLVLISIDTLRADRLPVYGYRAVSTPAIDRLAADGVVFERAYSHSPQTFPSHMALLSGTLPFENGVRDNVGFTVRPDVRLISEMLHDLGWATAGVVSAYVLRAELGLNRGFDFYDSQMPPAAPDVPMGQVQRDGTESLAVALRWMGNQKSARVFLFFHIYEPHTPYAPPERFARYAPYDGEIAYSDEIVGKLFAWLKDRGWYEQATIVLTSDHGEGLGDHGEQEHGLFLYDETIRVPLIVKLPSSARRGSRVTVPAQLVDLVPTILEWVGAPRPASLRGRSLAAVVGRSDATLGEPGFYAEALYGRYHFGWSEITSLTDSRYRYIKAPRPELYDLQADPRETNNLVLDRAQTASAMRGALDRLLAGATIHTPSPVAKEDLERLQALGYVGTGPAVPPSQAGEQLPDPKDKVAVLEAYRRAITLVGRRQYDEAIDLYRTILAEDPGMKDVWLQLATTLLSAGRHDEALTAFRRLVEIDPGDAATFQSLAMVYLTIGRPDEAIAHAEMGLKLARPEDTRTRTFLYDTLARAALARRDYGAARRYAAAAAEVDPSFPLPALVEGLILHGAGRFAEALPFFQETIRRLEGRTLTIPDLFYITGDTLGRLGRDAEAEAAFKTEIRLVPQNPHPRMGLAMLYRAQSRDAEVEQVIDDLLRVIPTRESYDLAIRLWTMFGEHDRARALKQKSRNLGTPRPAAAGR